MHSDALSEGVTLVRLVLCTLSLRGSKQAGLCSADIHCSILANLCHTVAYSADTECSVLTIYSFVYAPTCVHVTHHSDGSDGVHMESYHLRSVQARSSADSAESKACYESASSSC
jgi:hypothetical protein